MSKTQPQGKNKETCSNCRHWRPHAGSPTNMVCGAIGSGGAAGGGPVIVADCATPAIPSEPAVLATPGDFGCNRHSTAA